MFKILLKSMIINEIILKFFLKNSVIYKIAQKKSYTTPLMMYDKQKTKKLN